ncbi:unnamed protein product [Victoria cruziana]
MTAHHLLWLLFLLLLHPLLSHSVHPYDFSLFLDCGGQNNFTSQFNQSWVADRFYTGGSPGLVTNPHNFNQPQERTLRFFPVSSGKKNCYNVNVPNGRYFIRAFNVYDNYDSELHSPSFDVSVEGTLVFSWRSPWPAEVSRNGAYSDLFVFVTDGEATICFYSIATDAPVVSSLEIVQVDPLGYDSSAIGRDFILVNYGRLTCGSNSFGPGFTKDTDYFGRAWQSDKNFRLNSDAKTISTRKPIHGTNQAHDYFPEHLYQTAVILDSGKPLEYTLTVDARMDYLLWFHFAEIDSVVSKATQRVFDIYVNGNNVTRIDIFKQAGSFTALRWYYIVKKLNSTEMNVKFMPVIGPPLICGLENYAMVPLDSATVPSQVFAMKALKESLQVPERMGWNGDPCAPSSWDAWEGVTCHRDGKNGLVISQLDLASQGLKGYISDQINLLTNLVNLNLSLNSLTGSIPQGLGGSHSLAEVDLSSNALTGAIPESLGSSNLQVVLLNDNQLDGQVPERLYSIGVHGGLIDLSSNKGLCGVPTLPACPFFWSKGGLSDWAKIGIGIACLVLLLLLVLFTYMVCIRRGRHDYDFALPQDLISLAAKRNRYQRQKSMMLLEMESQSNGFSSSFNNLHPFQPESG